MDSTDRPILFFDGVCNLCNRSVQFIIKHDRKNQFLFSPLQGAAGAAALAVIEKQNGSPVNSVILFYKDKYYTRSTAALKVLQILGGVWRICSILIIIPPFFRNLFYDIVSRSRYKWFGKTDHCMVPTPELQSRFLK